jgi:hypothetical protein
VILVCHVSFIDLFGGPLTVSARFSGYYPCFLWYESIIMVLADYIEERHAE